jgi:hypothetical protein
MAELLQDRLEALAAAYREAARPSGPAAARRRGRQRRLRRAGATGLLAVALVAAAVTLGARLLDQPRPSTVAPAHSDPTLEWIPPANDRDGVERTGPIVLVTQGVTDRSTWKLATYPSGRRTCSVVVRDGRAVQYACGFDVPRRRPVMSSWTVTPGSGNRLFVHGQVVEQAAKVRLEFRNRDAIELPALGAPTDVGVRFFAASVQASGTLPAAVVALDQHGSELGRENLTFAPQQRPR